MKKKILVVLVAMVAVLALPVYVSATELSSRGDEACKYADDDYKKLICPPTQGSSEGEALHIVGNVLNTIYGIVGVLAVVMIVSGGVKYMTSQGDPGRLSAAKNTILYSAIGLVITILAFAITAFVLKALGR